eukprot:12407201-Karenia_brevis.AAC.1
MAYRYMSSTLLNLYLSSAEDLFDRKKWKTFCPNHHGPERSRVVAIARCEDDILLMSHLLCPDCITDLVKEAYMYKIAVDP